MSDRWTFTVNGVSACQVHDYSLPGYQEEMSRYTGKCIFHSYEEVKKAADAFDSVFPGFFVEIHNHPCIDSHMAYWKFHTSGYCFACMEQEIRDGLLRKSRW